MTDTITGGTAYAWVDGYYVETDTTAVITPSQILGFKSAAESGNILHPVLGSENTDVTLRPARRRKGELQLLFTGAAAEEDSFDAENALRSTSSFTLASDDLATVGMTFTVQGDVRRDQSDSRKAWTVTFGYQEVSL